MQSSAGAGQHGAQLNHDLRDKQSKRSKAPLLSLLEVLCRVVLLCSSTLVSALACSFSSVSLCWRGCTAVSVPPLNELQNEAPSVA